MVRRIVSITGTRADYGLMEPVYRAIARDTVLDLHLLVTGMHWLPEFASSLAQLREDRYGTLHELPMSSGGDTGKAMAEALARELHGIAEVLDRTKPDIVLLQGDRGEVLAGAIAAAHMNIAVVHMSGGDFSGSIDDSIRNAISKFAHFHLTNCGASTERLIAMGESPSRILTAGEPGLDQLLETEFLPLRQLEAELDLPPSNPFLIATLHPVTDEVEAGPAHMTAMLEALEEVGLTAVVTYPNSDAGGQAMRDVLEGWRGRPFLRIVPNLGSRRYLSALRHAAAVVGNSSSGLFDTPTLKVPAVNIGSRQTGRMRGCNVVDAAFDRGEIVSAIRYVLGNADFRASLRQCKNPFGDGHAARRTLDVLKRLRLGPPLIAKWRQETEPFLSETVDGF